MREIEMRQRIEGFLKRRMRAMLAPALGLGMAAAGCEKTVATPVYSSPNPDGQLGPREDAAGLTHDTPVYSAPIFPDAALSDSFEGKDTPSPGADGAPDIAAVADANVPSDAAKDFAGDAGGSEAHPGVDGGSSADSGADLGSMSTKYMAQLPDASPDLGPVVRYMASMPLG